LLVALPFALSGGVAFAAPATVESSQVFSQLTNICTGESITVSGTLRTVTIIDGSFGEGRITFSGMKGIGADGTKYVIPYAQGSTIEFEPGLVQTIEVNYLIIGIGQAADTHVHELLHLTFDANGRLVSLNHDLTVTC
jgi:hypothetical protein